MNQTIFRLMVSLGALACLTACPGNLHDWNAQAEAAVQNASVFFDEPSKDIACSFDPSTEGPSVVYQGVGYYHVRTSTLEVQGDVDVTSIDLRAHRLDDEDAGETVLVFIVGANRPFDPQPSDYLHFNDFADREQLTFPVQVFVSESGLPSSNPEWLVDMEAEVRVNRVAPRSVKTATHMAQAKLTASSDACPPVFENLVIARKASLDELDFEIAIIDSTAGTERVLTENEFQDVEPAWSPDGQTIAYVSNMEGPYRVQRVPASGGLPSTLALTSIDGVSTVVTPDTANWRNPVYAPDGMSILMTRELDRQLFRVDLTTLAAESLFVVSPDSRVSSFPSGMSVAMERDGSVYERDLAEGGTEREISASSGEPWSAPDVSPEGASIAIVSGSIGAKSVAVVRRDGTNAMALTDSSDYSPRQPRWSRAGDKIAFLSDDRVTSGTGLYIVDVEGSSVLKVLANPGIIRDLDWYAPSKSNDLVAAWQPNFGADLEIVRMSSATGELLQQLTDNELDDNEPSWSPDRSKIVFSRRTTVPTEYNTSELYEIPAYGGAETHIPVLSLDGVPTTDRKLYWSFPVYARDGESIYATLTENDAYAARAVYRIRVDTGVAVRIHDALSEGNSVRETTVSPDGARVVLASDGVLYGADGVDRASIALLNLASDHLYYSPDFSIDGSAVLFVGEETSEPFSRSVFTSKPDGTDLTALATDQLPEYVSLPKWSADGTRVIVHSYGGPSEGEAIYAIEVSTGAVSLLGGIEGHVEYWDW